MSEVAEVKHYKKSEIYKVEPTKIIIDPEFNVSHRTDDLSDIEDSILENGVLDPLQGYRDGEDFHLTSGHRRLAVVLKAIKNGNLNFKFISFIVKPKVSEAERLFDLLIHNTGKPLNEVQEAEVFQRLITGGFTQLEIAKKYGKTQAHISNRMKLISLNKIIKNYLCQDIINVAAANKLVENYETEQDQLKVLNKCLAKMKKAGKEHIVTTDIPNKVGRRSKKEIKSQSKYHRMFVKAIECMKEQPKTYTPVKINKIQTILSALDCKTPETFLKTLTSIL